MTENILGDPTPPDSDLPTWIPVSSDSHEYLRLDTESRMETSDDYLDVVNFWQEIMDDRIEETPIPPVIQKI